MLARKKNGKKKKQNKKQKRRKKRIKRQASTIGIRQSYRPGPNSWTNDEAGDHANWSWFAGFQPFFYYYFIHYRYIIHYFIKNKVNFFF